MVNQVPINNYDKPVFNQFVLKRAGSIPPAVQTVQENEQQKPSHKKRNIVYAVGSSALIAGVGALVLMKGLPKNTSKYIESIINFLEKRLEQSSLKDSDKWNEIYIYSIRKLKNFNEKAQSINNFTSIKDILFKNLMDRSKFTGKIHKGITNLFERISRKTVISSYKTTSKKFDKMYSSFDRLDKLLMKSNQDELITINGKTLTKLEWIQLAQQHRANIKSLVENFISPKELQNRYRYIKQTTSNLYNQFWDESFKDFWSRNNKFRRKEMWQTYIPETQISAGKKSLSEQVTSVRNNISYTEADTRNLIKEQILCLENLVAPSDKEGIAIIKKLKWFIQNPEGLNSSNSQSFLKELANLQARPLEEGLQEGVKLNQANLKNTCIQAIKNLLTKDNSGELQEMLAIYKAIAPYETSLIEKNVKKAVTSFDKSLKLETVEFFDKIRDLSLGSAPTDVLSILASGGMIGYGLTTAKDHDERVSVALKAGIPIIGAITTSLICAARLISGSKSMVIGAISGTVLGWIGKIADNLRKKED